MFYDVILQQKFEKLTQTFMQRQHSEAERPWWLTRTLTYSQQHFDTAITSGFYKPFRITLVVVNLKIASKDQVSLWVSLIVSLPSSLLLVQYRYAVTSLIPRPGSAKAVLCIKMLCIFRVFGISPAKVQAWVQLQSMSQVSPYLTLPSCITGVTEFWLVLDTVWQSFHIINPMYMKTEHYTTMCSTT